MIHIQVAKPFENHLDPPLLERAAAAVLEQFDQQRADMSVVFTNDAELAELNQQFRGISSSTDVLSFPAHEIDPDTGLLYLGDIIISVDRAIAQAAAAGHPLENELQLLVIHGALHILGYDHDTEERKLEMWAIQADILDRLGVVILQLPTD